MKFKKYGMMLAMAGLLASCANDNLEGPTAPEPSPELGEAYFSISVMPLGTRTQTGNVSTEEGLDSKNENDINVIQLIITNNDNEYITDHTISLNSADKSKKVTQIFELDAPELKKITDKSEETLSAKVFVICNPTETFTFTANADVQKTLELATSGITDTYWNTTKGFLMTNADQDNTFTLDIKGIRAGDYATGKKVHSLGIVKVQRAAARIDIATDVTPESKIAGKDKVSVEFDGVSIVNVNKKFYLFKRVGSSGSSWEYFDAENGTDNWVIDPIDKSNITDNFGEYFWDPASTTINSRRSYTLYSTIKNDANKDNDNISWNDQDQSVANAKTREYYIWRYVTPNNVIDTEGNLQKNGNTTGIIFRAELKKSESATISGWGSDPIFAYGGKIYGNYDALCAAAAEPGDDATTLGMSAVFNSLKSGDTNPNANALAADARFKRYNADNGTYYCYYYYWIRHNNNYDNDVMGNMEFQVVRNNIYKLAVTSVSDYGYPGDTQPDPSTPDEDPKNDVNFSVEVQVVPWDVRVDDIEF